MAEIAVLGAGVVGSAVALELSRRGAQVVMLEAEPEPGLQASGTNSGILHTGFDSLPGELETEMILRAGALRGPVLEALEVPVIRCGALMAPRDEGERRSVAALAANADRNGVEVISRADASLEIPGESVTDPVAFTLALGAAARRHGARLQTDFRVSRVECGERGLVIAGPDGAEVRCRAAVNCAGLGAARIARLAGDESFDVHPRKGEFLVFEQSAAAPLERILLPVPSPGTKGVLVFPTVDHKVVAGPTAVDQEDPDDWTVRAEAAAEILPKAARLYPPLASAEPIFAYAGLRPAGRGVNYVIGASVACPSLVNVAAIRSTGMTASLAIAERVAEIVAGLGVELGSPVPLLPVTVPATAVPWWRRTAEHRAQIGETPSR